MGSTTLPVAFVVTASNGFTQQRLSRSLRMRLTRGDYLWIVACTWPLTSWCKNKYAILTGYVDTGNCCLDYKYLGVKFNYNNKFERKKEEKKRQKKKKKKKEAKKSETIITTTTSETHKGLKRKDRVFGVILHFKLKNKNNNNNV